jgi:DNA adenine methylase
MDKIRRPILRYFGGKFLLAEWIVENMPEHRVYVEPYGGAASVLMRKKRAYAEVYNDLNQDIVGLFTILRNPDMAKELERQLRLTPYARAEFELASDATDCALEASRRLIIRSFMGFGAESANDRTRATGFRGDSNKSGSTPARDWVNYADSIPHFSKRLLGVVIENLPALEIIKKYDAKDALFYVDPPYPFETRGDRQRYLHEMDSKDHTALLEALREVKGMVMLSSYPNPAYEALGWHSLERKAYADGARERREVLYFNNRAVSGIKQIEFF